MKKTNSSRKSSALLTATAGAAVCLSGGGVAHAVTGNIAASNAGQTNFSDNDMLKAFNGQAQWFVEQATTWTSTCTPTTTFTTTFFTTTTTTFTGPYSSNSNFNPHPQSNMNPIYGSNCTSTTTNTGPIYLQSMTGTPGVNGTYFANMHSAGVSINSAMAGGFGNNKRMSGSQSNKYLAVQFVASGTKYGWIHVVSTCACGQTLQADQWGYDTTGGNIKTLSTSLNTRSLPLSDGRMQLHWTNKNEAGVSRYEVQRQNAAGVWEAVGAEAPGAGRYSVVVPGAGIYRVAAEKVDGATEAVAF